MFILASLFYPYDPPNKSVAGSNSVSDDIVSLKDITSKLGCVSVAGCVACSMYCYSGKEPIASPILVYHFGLSEFVGANVLTVEGYAFIAGTILINFVPARFKNFNKLCMIGVVLYFLGMMIGGPIILIDIPRNMGVMFITIGIIFTGTG